MLKISKIYILLSFLMFFSSVAYGMEERRRYNDRKKTAKEVREAIERLLYFVTENDPRAQELIDNLIENGGNLRRRVETEVVEVEQENRDLVGEPEK